MWDFYLTLLCIESEAISQGCGDDPKIDWFGDKGKNDFQKLKRATHISHMEIGASSSVWALLQSRPDQIGFSPRGGESA